LARGYHVSGGGDRSFAASVFFYRVFLTRILAGSGREVTRIIVLNHITRPPTPNY